MLLISFTWLDHLIIRFSRDDYGVLCFYRQHFSVVVRATFFYLDFDLTPELHFTYAVAYCVQC